MEKFYFFYKIYKYFNKKSREVERSPLLHAIFFLTQREEKTEEKRKSSTDTSFLIIHHYKQC